MDSMRFGTYDHAMLIQINYVGAPDAYRTKKTIEFVTEKLYEKYNINIQTIYITYRDMSRDDAIICGK